MKRLISSLIGIIFCLQSIAQLDSSISIIENAIRSRKSVHKIIYSDSSLTFYHNMTSLVQNNILKGFKDNKEVYLKLLKAEVHFLNTQFKKTKPIGWKKNLFSNSLMINLDTLQIFTDTVKGSVYFEKTFDRKFFIFSQPVYFRNNSIAIFRLAEMILSSCGNDLLFVYIKKGNEWKQEMIVQLGAW